MALLVLLVVAFVFVYGQHTYCFKHWDENLKLDIRFSRDMVGVGEKFEIVENVSNKKRLPLPIFRIKFQTGRDLKSVVLVSEKNNATSDKFYYSDSLAVRGYEEIERRLECTCLKRGIYAIDKLYVSTNDLLLMSSFHDVFKANACLLVYPKRVNYGKMEYNYNQLNGDILAKLKYLADPFEFRGIREYMPGDGLRKINFKASARSNDLMVNTFNQTIQRSVCIICDVSTSHSYVSDSLIEGSLGLASTIAEDLLLEGYEVSFVSNGKDYFNKANVCVSSGSGVKHLTAIHEGVAVIDLSEECVSLSEYELDDNSIAANAFCIIISSNQTEAMVKSIKHDFTKGREFMWIVPTDRSLEYTVPSELHEVTREWKNDGY